MVDVSSALIAFLLWFATVTASSIASQQVTPATTSQQNLNQPVASEPWFAPDVYDRDSRGITMPELVKQTKPNYPGEAMRARIEGIVGLECIIEKDGSVGPVRVRHSLDTATRLDDEAINTVRQWRFKPGTKDGIPVRMRVPIE